MTRPGTGAADDRAEAVTNRGAPVVRVAAVGDLHLGVGDDDEAGLDDVADHADLLLLAGDLTRCGDPREARVVAAAIRRAQVPVVAVLGNHDVHTDRADEVTSCLAEAGARVLEGESTTVEVGDISVGIAGGKGFGGGFAGACATEFGEPEMRAFAGLARTSAASFGAALGALGTDLRLGLLHYSPVADTLVGEPPEIQAFLGSSMLAEAIDTVGADLVVHGHAHRGAPRGRTPGGVRVRNVARPVIGERYRVFSLPVGATASTGFPTVAHRVSTHP